MARAPIDLPARAHADLPAPRGGSVDLPAKGRAQTAAPRPISDLPVPGPGADLPALRNHDFDLPSVSGGSDLPAPLGFADLPSAKQGGGFGELDLPIVQAAGLPSPAAPAAHLPDLAPAASFLPTAANVGLPTTANVGLPTAANVSLPANRSRPPSSPPSAFDEFGLEHAETHAPPEDFSSPLRGRSTPPPGGSADEDFFSKGKSAPPPLQRQSGGGVSFGEVDLGGGGGGSFSTGGSSPPPAGGGAGWGERDLGGAESADDDMEFGAIPQERKEGEAAPPPASRPPSASASVMPPAAPAVRVRGADRIAQQEPAKPGRGLRVAAIGLAAVVLVGGALSFTPYGAFGYYVAFDALKKNEFDALQASTLTAMRAAIAKDTADAAAQSLSLGDQAHAKAPRARGVSATAAYFGFLRELRFGHDAAVHAHAKGLLVDVPPDMSSPAIDLARAGQTATTDQLARAQSMAEAALRRAPTDVDALVLSGEIALAMRDGDKAIAAFTKLAAAETTPRAQFGLARAQLLKNDKAAAKDSATAVLKTSPTHPGAHLLLARLAWEATHDETKTTPQLDAVLKDPAGRASASATELVEAYTLAGQIQLRKSRVTAAEAAFNEALKLDPKSAGALAGVGEALYRASRFAEALARFNSAVESDPTAVEPKIGIAKTKIALERLQEAKDNLKALAKSLKDADTPNFHVISWLGRAEEALGDKAAAEADYNEAIKLAGADSEIVDTYVWLAQLLTGQARTAEAEAKLTEAKAKLPRSLLLFKALGEIALQAGRYEDAERDFTAALAMDDTDVNARFKLGVTLRRMGKFEDAGTALDRVAELDKDYPGLALERAVLFDASGQTEKALDQYNQALAKAPDDPDLKLRVAAAEVATADPAKAREAEKALRSVLLVRQNSPEVNYYLGRALLIQGSNYAEALRYLRRATDGDPNRAEYWLYVGWASNDTDDQGAATNALGKALELDKSLADAYWQRGVLRRRQRDVTDAEVDLLKALELRPSRYEAYATLAEVYEDQQKWPQALDAWQKAIAANGEKAEWRFRLGKLMTQNGNRAGAYPHLAKAVELAKTMQTTPAWLADASLLLADAERGMGKRAEAVEHYQMFLSLAPQDSPYVKDACASLAGLGQPCKPR